MSLYTDKSGALQYNRYLNVVWRPFKDSRADGTRGYTCSALLRTPKRQQCISIWLSSSTGRGKLDVELLLGYRGYWVRAQGELKLMYDKVTTHVYDRQLLLVLKNLDMI